jgi:NTP pyrophosphatase (non-canonical NTP hydrolase)
MKLNEYQKKAMSTCMDTCDNLTYMLLNLVGEVGEFASKVAKHVRKGEARIFRNHLVWVDDNTLTDEENEKKIADAQELLKAEAGDILWQLSGLCQVMGWSLEDVAQSNLDKLASRKERGVIDGEGDNR